MSGSIQRVSLLKRILPFQRCKNQNRGFVVFLISLFSYTQLVLGAGCLENTTWKQCREAGDILVCSSKYGSSEIKAVRGIAKIQAPIRQLIPVLYDVEHYKNWQVNVKGIEVVEEIVAPGEKACLVERIEHSYGKKPWLVRWVFWVPDSDFVYKASYHLSPDATHFALYLDNYSSRDVPEEKKYRRGAVQSCYVLESEEDANETLIRVEVWVDLNLDLDSSRINASLKDWPTDLIKGLRSYVKEPVLTTDINGLNEFLGQCLENEDVN